MILIEDIEKIKKPFPSAVLTIGNFDGVHVGHQALFHQVIEEATALGGTSVAMTFEPHPLRVLKPNGHPPQITVNAQKLELIAGTGIDVIICVPFTRTFAAIDARTFVSDILVRRIGMRAIIIGNDYTFGRHREGNIDLLRQMGRELGFQVQVADWIRAPQAIKDRISSTKIRELVQAGEMERARYMLGRYYQIRGKVVAGRRRGGALLGVPTANIILQDELCPPTGVYAVMVQIGETRHPGVANIGYSPTFDDHVFTVEVHLLDFQEDIYDRDIRVNFIRRIRDEIRFDRLEALSDQIRQDIQTARQILATTLS
ncbi:MAG: bifunctional riboflavin kinase/FAD synthetase [Desulfobacterales bacterium]|jgi:riboflavin kinase/FMN adenylyltransferase|nr:bifunctional riboflavin kinase/FAD synthetase [Desulfobacteraceae bacterium]MDD3992191.1 bifunctional riboflavin kinase/FAD synthetase [Desulfobacteraceae bacterium]MDY0312761.1 bifunctional riboflavin kinase/FAD synthetase [Desulfobacterales bacterium]